MRWLFLACLVGCSHGASKVHPDAATVIYVAQVPHFALPGNESGVAVLASVLAYYGVTRSPTMILEDLPRTISGGVLALDIALYPRRFGLDTAFGRGDLDAMEAQLSASHPVIVMLDDGASIRYALVVGLDRAHEVIVIHTAEHSNVVVRLPEFRRAWSRAGHWMTAVARKGHRSRTVPVQSA
jgi:ABC-type bacteriocin/lantibiotic exporter with double-glycine peptidase domain